MNFTPRNRFLLIKRQEKKQEKETAFILPEDYKPQESRHRAAEIIEVSPDCSDLYEAGMLVIIDNRMVEEFEVDSNKVELILENYVFGVLA